MAKYQITGPDGARFEVEAPDTASHDDVLKFAQQNFHSAPRGMSQLERFGTGMKDPLVGAAQLAGHTILPTSTMESIDKYAQERERGIQETRGGDTSTDWWRLGGNLASPVNFIPVGGAAVRGAQAASKLGNLARTVGAGAGFGAMGGATQPVTGGQDYWEQKRGDVATGAALGGVVGAGTGAVSTGVRALGEHIAREFPEAVETQAVQAILRRLQADAKAQGVKAKDVIDLVVAAQKSGKPMTVADVAGENTLALAGHLYRSPSGERTVAGPRGGAPQSRTFDSRNFIRQFLEKRDQGAVSRLEKDIDQNLYGGASAFTTKEALMKARSADARPYYEQMKGIAVGSPRLEHFFANPVIQKGLKRGLEIERDRALVDGRPFDAAAMQQAPTLYVMDVAKQGLDHLIEGQRNEITGRLSRDGVRFDQLRREFLNVVDGLDKQGVYKKARELWAGPSASLDAIKFGQSIFEKWDPEELAAEFGKLSDSNKEFARLGVASALKVKLFSGGVSSDEAKLLVRSQLMRMKLEPFFENPQDFNAFMDAVANEQQMFDTQFLVMRGSQTAERVMEDQSSQNMQMASGAHLAHHLANRNWFSAARTAVDMWRDLGLKNNPVLNEKIAEFLFTTPIPKTGQLQAWLKGSKAKRFALPKTVDPLRPIAGAVNTAGMPAAQAAGIGAAAANALGQ
jgi:hypothetical protein